MLEYSEIRPGKYIIYNKEPYEVIDSHVARTQMRKPQNQTKLRSLLNGRIVPATFHATDKVEEADLGKRTVKFLYHNKGEYWFCEEKDPSKRFKIDEKLLGEPKKFLKGNILVEVLTFSEDDDEEPKIIGIRLPIKVELKVTDAPPSIKGNTASGGGKTAVLETGATVTVPFFVNVDDVIRVNTETGEYVERVEKK
ncbi:MAG: elongation factor P [Patescibacteria group bacterium]